MTWLNEFLIESLAIEGIHRPPTANELQATADLSTC